jgi:uncharacterized RDD family membrane protein YckC
MDKVMASEEKKGATERRSRYVWDAQKLAWVEVADETADEVQPAPAKVSAVPSSDVTEEQFSETSVAQAPVEAVSTEYMGAWVRLAAFILDYVILVVLVFIVSRIHGMPSWTGLVLGFIYFVGLWLWRGQTVGKMIIGAKIVKRDGSTIGPINAFLRYIFYIVPNFAPILAAMNSVSSIRSYYWFILALAFIMGMSVMGFSADKLGIHDRVAGTAVIKSRGRKAQPVEVEVFSETEAGEPSATSQSETHRRD